MGAIENKLKQPALFITIWMVAFAVIQLFYIVKSSDWEGNSAIKNIELAKFQLQTEWEHSQFISDVFVVPGDESCSQVYADGQELFTYDWQGLTAYWV